MASIEKIVQDIRVTLNDQRASVELDAGVVTRLATEYEEVFLRAAEKANRCLELLHEGSRQAAVKLACQEPDLRTQFACIDFEERLQWIKLCEGFSIQCDNISTDNFNACAGIIERVYKNTDNLTELLRLHRRLALMRSSLTKRLKVLRLIAQEDQMNGVWADDIKSYEKEYLEELAVAAKQAIHQKDLQTLEEISNQLHCTEWRIRLSEKFVKTVDQYVLENRQGQANTKLRQIAENIHQSHAAMNEQECRYCYDAWTQVLEQFNVEPPHDLLEHIQPAIDWLDELQKVRGENDAFNDACAKLEQSIDENGKVDDIEKQAAKILSFEKGMPELLAARFTSRMQSLKLKRKRMFSIAITAVVGVLLIIIAGLSILFIRFDQNKQIARWQQQIASALQSDSLESAEKLLSQVKNENQKIFYAPEIQQLSSQYQQKYALSQEREQALEQMLASFENQDISGLTSEMLEKADQLAQNTNQKTLVFNWRTKYNDYIREQQQQRDQLFEAQLNQLDTEYSKYKTLTPSELVIVVKEIRQYLFRAEELIAVKDISAGLLSRSRILREKIRNDLQRAQDETAERQKIEDALIRLAKPYKDASDLSTDLRAFIDAHQGHELSVHFIKALNYANEWSAADAWNSLVQGWLPNLLTGDATVIQQRLEQIDNYLKVNPSTPYRNQCSAYESYLKLAQSKLSSLQTDELEEVLRLPLIAESLMIESKDKKCYYMFENTFSVFQEKQYQFKYIADSALKEKNCFLSKDSIDPKELKPSPQSVFSERALKKLSTIKEDRWETVFLDLALECAQDKKMDCVLKANLIKLFLLAARNNISYKTERIEAMLDKIETVELDINWVDPTNQKANQLRPEVVKIVTSTSDAIKQAIQEINAELQAMQGSLAPVRLAGIILDQGNSIIIHRQESTRNGRAMVIGKKDNKEVVFIEIGKIVDYKFSGNTTAIPSGTPVFVSTN